MAERPNRTGKGTAAKAPTPPLNSNDPNASPSDRRAKFNPRPSHVERMFRNGRQPENYPQYDEPVTDIETVDAPAVAEPSPAAQ